MFLPVVAFAALAFGCADESTVGTSDDAVEEKPEILFQQGAAPTDVSEDAPFGKAHDGTPWPAKCDAVYRINVNSTIAAGAETHPQTFVDAPWGNEEVQGLAMRPITDNKKVLHHWIAYANAGGFAFLTGWAPGQDETETGKLPDDVAMFLPKGPRAIRMDMHYYNKQGTTAVQDKSGFEICTTKTPRKYTSTTFMGFAGIPIIAPNQTVDIVGTCKVRVTEPVFLMTVSAHAHQLATHMKFTHERAGKVTTLWDAPFNFEEQTSTAIKGGALELKNGDIVKTVCTFKNTTNRTVTFGENTGNEMCFNFSTYYPRNALSCG
ncbi:MAG: hypothetical protein ABW252_15925, partial [Polyangiales bacterium]